MIEDFKREYFECSCYSDEHLLTFSFSMDKKYPEVYCHVMLNHNKRWYKRIWIAIKYVFGYQSIYGMFDEIILKPKDIVRLKALCQEFEWFVKNNAENEFLAKEIDDAETDVVKEELINKIINSPEVMKNIELVLHRAEREILRPNLENKD